MGEGAFHCWVLWVWAHHDKNPLLPQVPEAFPTLLAASDTLCHLIAATSEAIRAGITSFCGCVFRSESRRQGDGGLGVDKEGPKFSPWLSGTTASGPMHSKAEHHDMEYVERSDKQETEKKLVVFV